MRGKRPVERIAEVQPIAVADFLAEQRNDAVRNLILIKKRTVSDAFYLINRLEA